MPDISISTNPGRRRLLGNLWRDAMLQTNEIADRLDQLERHALALTSAIDGLEVLNERVRSGVSDLAWDMSKPLRNLSDEVLPDGGAKIKAVAS